MGDQPASSNEPSNVLIDTPFWPDQQMVWLKENQDKLAEKLIAVLEETELEAISDIMLDPPEMKYDAIKARLVSIRERRLGKDCGWLLELLTGMKLDDQRPSCLLNRMRNIVAYAVEDVPDATVRSMWMNQLTMEMRTAIIIMESLKSGCTLDELAKVADKLIDYDSFVLRELSYLEDHNKPSQMLMNMQMLEYTPDVFNFFKSMKKLQSYLRIAIAIAKTMNGESTVKDIGDIAGTTRYLRDFNQCRIKQLLESVVKQGREETTSHFITRMMYTSSDISQLHVWMMYLPPNVLDAIAIRQALDENLTDQELAQLADKIAELKEPNEKDN